MSDEPAERSIVTLTMNPAVDKNCSLEHVVTSLGSGGAVLTTADQHLHIRSPTVPIRSKVGAGDSTVAGIVTALARGAPIFEAVGFGVAAGAAAVMTEGTELCRRKDVQRLFDEWKPETIQDTA